MFWPRKEVRVLRSEIVPPRDMGVGSPDERVPRVVVPPRPMRGEDVVERVAAVRVGVKVVRLPPATREVSGAARVMVGTPLLVVREGEPR